MANCLKKPRQVTSVFMKKVTHFVQQRGFIQHGNETPIRMWA